MALVTLPAGMTVEKIEAFWRRAAMDTYVSGREPKKIAGNGKEFWFEDLKVGLWYRDAWFSAGENGFGQTLIGIWADAPTAIWFMQYHGFMKKDAKPMLLHALQEGLKITDRFLGCRGPQNFPVGDDVRYHNDVRGCFTDFASTEVIVRGCGITSERLHKHECAGKLLVA